METSSFILTNVTLIKQGLVYEKSETVDIEVNLS